MPNASPCARRADAAGDVLLLADDVFPEPIDGVGQLLVAGEGGDVGRGGVQIRRPHRVADRFVLLAERLVILAVFAPQLGPVVGRRAAKVDVELREVEVPAVARHAIQLHQSQLHFGMPGRHFHLVRGRTCLTSRSALFVATSRKFDLPVAS